MRTRTTGWCLNLRRGEAVVTLMVCLVHGYPGRPGIAEPSESGEKYHAQPLTYEL
jgi:hypothetical protein